MRSGKHIILVVLLTFCLGTLSFILVKDFLVKKNAFIDISTVYKEFDLTKENEMELDSIREFRNFLLDSLINQIKIEKELYDNKPMESQRDVINKLIVTYETRKEFFESDNQEIALRHQKEAIRQLNAYIVAYAKLNDYDFLLGATESGSIMFAKPELDKTKDALHYINERYKGESIHDDTHRNVDIGMLSK